MLNLEHNLYIQFGVMAMESIDNLPLITMFNLIRNQIVSLDEFEEWIFQKHLQSMATVFDEVIILDKSTLRAQ